MAHIEREGTLFSSSTLSLPSSSGRSNTALSVCLCSSLPLIHTPHIQTQTGRETKIPCHTCDHREGDQRLVHTHPLFIFLSLIIQCMSVCLLVSSSSVCLFLSLSLSHTHTHSRSLSFSLSTHTHTQEWDVPLTYSPSSLSLTHIHRARRDR